MCICTIMHVALINFKHSKGLQSSVNSDNCLAIYLCMRVHMFSAQAGQCWGRLGDKTSSPVQRGCQLVLAQAKSPHRHLFIFSTEKGLLSLKPHTRCPIPCLSQSSGLNTGVTLETHTMFFFSTISFLKP